jgi:hypothetical protein
MPPPFNSYRLSIFVQETSVKLLHRSAYAIVVGVVLACLATAVHVRAQAGTGTLSGTVVDEQGAAVPGAKTTSTSASALAQRNTQERQV